MGLLVFAAAFGLCNIALYLLGNMCLPKGNKDMDIVYRGENIIGYEGRFETFNEVELMRKKVNRKKSKF
jgi:hypothetical protein